MYNMMLFLYYYYVMEYNIYTFIQSYSYSAVIESRRIFRKLKAYVTYRFAATIQIVIVLTLLIFISNCPITSLYVIILALFNDLTMLPIAYDRQQAAATPENPDVAKMLTISTMLGVLETCFSLLFAYGADATGFFQSDLSISGCGKPAQAAMWLQMFIAAEVLIFSARAPTYMWQSIAPSGALFVSVITGCLICSVLAAISSYFGSLPIRDIILIWIYDILVLIVIDIAKVAMFQVFNESLEVLPDLVQDIEGRMTEPGEAEGSVVALNSRLTVESGMVAGAGARADTVSRADESTRRMSEWAAKDERLSVQRRSFVPS